MKSMKKLWAMVLAIVMVLAMAIPASADGTGTGTDTNVLIINSKTSGHTYQAYQVFKGTYFGGVLSNVEWGTGVNGPELLEALRTDVTLSEHFTDCVTAADVAEVLSKDGSSFTNDSVLLDALADVVSQYVQGGPATSGQPSGGNGSDYVYRISNLADGYYFVKEADMGNDDNNAYTKFMLKVVGETEVDAKADVPSISKTFSNDSTTGNAAIGDTVNFKLRSAVPNMDGYNKYFFVVHDTLSDGLTFKDDVAVTVGGSTLTKDDENGFNVETNGQQITIILKNFIQYQDNQNRNIEITYSATVNTDAVIGVAGNPNKVHLEYSNNPNVEAEGDPTNSDKPGTSDPTGVTPEDKTYTYVTGLELKKEDTQGHALTGAQFQLSGTALNTVLVYRDEFAESPDGEYYKLKDGTYTTEAPNGNENLYENPSTKYERTTKQDVVTKGESEVTATGTVGDDGILRFDGLSAGEYTIEELIAPDGYNLLKDEITFTVTCILPENLSASTNCTWTVTDSQNANGISVNEDGIITLTVKNKQGSTLPETGGIGTTIFYVVGGILVVGAGVLLVAKKRMSADNNK